MASPRTMTDPSESFTGAEIDPATDRKEAVGRDEPAISDANAAEGPVIAETEGLAVTGEALVTAVERDLLAMGPGAEWGPDSAEEFDEGEQMGQAVSDILSAEWSPEDKRAALEELMAEESRGIVEATQHLTGMLTGTDTPQASGDNNRDAAEQEDATTAVAAEVGRVSQNAEGAATIIVNSLRSNVGVATVSGVMGGFVNYT